MIQQLPESLDALAYVSLYALLDVAETVKPLEMRRAYQHQALRCHADKLASRLGTSACREGSRGAQTFGRLQGARRLRARAEFDRQRRAGEWRWAILKVELAGGLASTKEAFWRCSEELERSSVQEHVATRALASRAWAVAQSVVAAELRSSLVAGEKLVVQATARTTSKAIPLLGAILGAALECATTAFSLAPRAAHVRCGRDGKSHKSRDKGWEERSEHRRRAGAVWASSSCARP